MNSAPIKKAVRKRVKPEEVSSPPLRFAAIDFETADYGRDSACALSVVLVQGTEVEKTVTHLIRPPRKEIVFEYLHGISWRQVASKPVFGELWPELLPLFEKVSFIAAHNATFDRSVMHTCCDGAGHTVPAAPFICTVKLARRLWDIYPTKLPDVCRRLKINLRHHDAASDALACAKIVIEAHKAGFNPLSLVKEKKSPKKAENAQPVRRSVRRAFAR
jgi:DNA polymerase-3 subunit epsilon